MFRPFQRATLVYTTAGFLLAPSQSLAVSGQASGNLARVLKLQPFAERSQPLNAADGGVAVLTNLNRHQNSWFVLEYRSPRTGTLTLHLENADPSSQTLALDPDYTAGLVIARGDATERCPLFGRAHEAQLTQSKWARQPYLALCHNRVFVRKKMDVYKAAVAFRKQQVQDLVAAGRDPDLQPLTPGQPAPPPAQVTAAAAGAPIPAQDVAVAPAGGAAALQPGRWYESLVQPGVFVSAIRPQNVQPEILASHPQRVMPLQPREQSATAHLVAFDLQHFAVAFSTGTDRPKLGWSSRTGIGARQGRPGPDGLANAAPLALNGVVPPHLVSRLVGTFTAGFKRHHGVFRHGPLAQRNRGHYYGFMENGVILSTLQPNLATLAVRRDGQVEMKTWTESDRQDLAKLVHARQNGVPLLERTKDGTVPGRFVKDQRAGNWAVSAAGAYASIRAGACLVSHQQRQYLVYGNFAHATPNAMVRVFQAYGCEYAMHLDMNALEHTYLAIYHHTNAFPKIHHLLRGMHAQYLDIRVRGQLMPRFVGTAGDRDFFYVTRRAQTSRPLLSH